jgi:hypothetical protein
VCWSRDQLKLSQTVDQWTTETPTQINKHISYWLVITQAAKSTTVKGKICPSD